MNNTEKMLDLNKEIDTFMYGELSVFLFSLIILFAGCLFVAWLEHEKSNHKILIKVLIGFFSVSFVLLCITAPLTVIKQNEFNELKSDFFSSIQSNDIVINKVLNNVTVLAENCPNREFDPTYNCQYIEFLQDNEKIQVFVPVKKDSPLNDKEPIRLTYYDVDTEKRVILNKLLDMEGKNINDSFKIEGNTWLLGIETEQSK